LPPQVAANVAAARHRTPSSRSCSTLRRVTPAPPPAASFPSSLSHPVGSVRGVVSRAVTRPPKEVLRGRAQSGVVRRGPPPRGRPRLANARVDTLTLARRLIRDEVPDCRLATLAARFRTVVRPTHRALDDVLATAEVLHGLFERAAGYGVLALDDLLGLPASPLARRKLPLLVGLPRAAGVYLFRGADGR